jgi:hypothetical protein
LRRAAAIAVVLAAAAAAQAEDDAARLAAARKAAIAGDAAACVKAALEDPAKEVRLTAAIGIVATGDAARPALLERAQRAERPGRSTPNPSKTGPEDLSTSELLAFLDPSFAGALVPAAELAVLHDAEAGFRAVAARALGEVARTDWLPPSAKDALERAAKDDDARVREAAQAALARARGK